MECRDFLEVADSYLSDELLVETNHDVIAHLEACADCRRELAARRKVRSTLRTAFTNTEELRIDDQYETRLRDQLRTAATSERSPARRRAWLAIAACLIAGATFAVIAVWQRQQSEKTAGERHNASDVTAQSTQPSPADVVAGADVVLAKMSELAAGDHRDCAIHHRLPDRPISLQEAGRKYDAAYLNLTKAVMAHASTSAEPIELVMAHACVFKGHWFAHIAVRHRGRVASLLVTRLENQRELVKPKDADQHGQVIACSSIDGYQISCFQTARHAVFVVSDLSEGENLALARRLSAPVYEHITRA